MADQGGEQQVEGAGGAGEQAVTSDRRTGARATTRSRTRSIAFVGLTIALMGVSAWVAIPLGPVLLTLQMFALMFALLALTPKQCLAAIAGYLALGAVGLPMFSGMRGGIGMLVGPTGGYLWGYLVGASAALLVLQALRTLASHRAASAEEASSTSASVHKPSTALTTPTAFAIDLAGCLVFIAITYACGCFQYALVAGIDLAAAAAVTIAPFAIPDLLKAIAAVICARAVRRALPSR